MSTRTDRSERSLGATLLVWGLALLGALFVLSVVVATVISIVTTVVAIVTMVATALLLAGIAYLAASWALGSAGSGRGHRGYEERGRGDRGREMVRRPRTEYDGGAAAERRSAAERSNRERSDGSLFGRIPGIGGSSDDSDERASAEDPIERLTDQYVRGEIGEAEYESRLERHLGRSESSRRRTGERTLERE